MGKETILRGKFVDNSWTNLQIRGLIMGKRRIPRGQIKKIVGWLWADVGFPVGEFIIFLAGNGQS